MLIITLDGPAGVGKTTLARRLAEELRLPYLDTGAMFRFLALQLGEESLNLPEPELAKLAQQWQFSLQGVGNATQLLVNGQPIGNEIRTEQVSLLAAKLGQSQALRNILAQAQRDLGKNSDLVAEGRDLGTVIFPDANYKFFLDASPEARAKRRWLELKDRGSHQSLEEITELIRKRDNLDRTRPIAPLKAAPDAIIIDTSNLSIESGLAKLLSHLP